MQGGKAPLITQSSRAPGHARPVERAGLEPLSQLRASEEQRVKIVQKVKKGRQNVDRTLVRGGLARVLQESPRISPAPEVVAEECKLMATCCQKLSSANSNIMSARWAV